MTSKILMILRYGALCVVLLTYFGTLAADDGEMSSASLPQLLTNRASDSQRKLRVAVCLTGQLLRLEVLSKIRNLIAYNSVYLGHKMDVFVMLDNNITDAKQTFWREDYSNSIYKNMTTRMLQKYFEKHVKLSISNLKAESSSLKQKKWSLSPVAIRVVLEPPTQMNYTIRDGKVPVGDKTGPIGEGLHTVGSFEPAAERFQNNMRWLGGLRGCMKWVQRTEHDQKWFYDIVIRLRDDSYVLGPWPIPAEKYKDAFVTAALAPNFGVNDHNFAIDRKWADTVFRGVTEDYYFNETLDMYSWPNTERRIYKILSSKNIPIRTADVCEQPVAHLRGMINSTYWRLHPTYSEQMVYACEVGGEEEVGMEQTVSTASAPLPTPLAALAQTPDRPDGQTESYTKYFWQTAMSMLNTVGIVRLHSLGIGGKGVRWAEERPSVKGPERNLEEEVQDPSSTSNSTSSCCHPEWLAALKLGSVGVHV
jgi:hypothetical protein